MQYERVFRESNTHRKTEDPHTFFKEPEETHDDFLTTFIISQEDIIAAINKMLQMQPQDLMVFM